MPPSLCDAILHPFAARGVGIKHYALDGNLGTVPSALEDVVDSTVRAVYVIHYYGFPSAMEPLRKFAENRGLLLIEDCALALGGEQDGTPLGMWGNAAIFSLRKFLPCLDGGLLRSTIDGTEPADAVSRRWEEARNRLRRLLQRSPVPKFLKQRMAIGPDSVWNTDKPPLYEPQSTLGDSRISRSSLTHLGRLDLRHLRLERRWRYERYARVLATSAFVRPLFPTLPKGVSPFSFPVICENRPVAVARLLEAGIAAEPSHNHPYYDFPGLVNSQRRFPDQEALWRSLLSLPVHQCVPEATINRALEVLSR